MKQFITHKIKKHKFKLASIGLCFILWFFCLPSTLFDVPTATVVESKGGNMIGARIADDGQWRFPKVDSIPYRFEQSILHFEDEYFYKHPGFNPISISKALWGNITTNKRRGGSTLTQQVIRLSRKNKKRSYGEKLIEIIQATRLEAGYSKKEILNLYASHAPFGGNVVGLETASWRYFGVRSRQLSWGQSAALAVLPNAPSLIFPGKNETIFKKKRDRLLLKLFQNEIIDKTTYELAILEPLPGKPFPLPEVAPHFTEKIKQQYKGQRIQSTIDFSLQKQINRITKEHHYLLSQNEINNLSILVLDVTTREVVAYVGNAPTTLAHNNYVDIIDKPRSTGSILKPFLYTALLDAGELLPNTLVADIPTNVNGYNPQNFDKEFNGAVPASTALARSLNVPAVRMLKKYGLERFYNSLKKLNQKSINKNANHYGLSLILGGAESSLWEVTAAYAGLASTLNYYTNSSSEYRANEFSKPIFNSKRKYDFGKVKSQPTVFNAGAIYNAFDAMRKVNRPQGEENWDFFNDAQPIAWKTGTSFGFKDAWAVGVTPKYAIGVWVGNADGEGRPGLTGIQAAAPLLFNVVDVLPKTEWFAVPYDELIESEICHQSGHLASVYCNEVITEFIPKNGIKTAACQYHQRTFLDATETYRVNTSCYLLANMQQRNWFSLPPVMEYYYAPLHPEYKPLPPFKNDCLQEGERTMDFIFPKKNETILLAKNFEENTNEVIFKLAHRDPETKVYWYLDDTFVGTTETFHELAIVPKLGEYVLSATDQEGNEVSQKIAIDFASK
ncbi:penicillin-binding protein 1C [Patiriisocius hiemis]|uniref:peptidoglycan glycosyltransferase n=1 Tax=Patiriisocius hiemis TaxID=3075604 RepID=A0ABU2YBV8_9FLAO|nr:penicillin-binding protein 1C [Constantimarinum sp. W242]MDT0555679.1 penicillin-binding protein 1C [Constantimarinum sp. W242]